MNIMSLSMQTEKNDSGILAINNTPDFEICGEGSASEWGKAEWEIIPKRNNDEIDYITRVKILYSVTGIYFLFHCEDNIITATMQKDNLNLWEEDVVEVFLMPEERFPLYFEYQLSPLNYELTILIPNLDGNRRLLGWLPWNYEGERRTRHKTTIIKDANSGDVEGWMAEFFIPWVLLDPLVKEPPMAGAEWKANMYRLDYDKGSTRYTWQKVDRHFHEPHNFGTFLFK
jgi:hypothetical protein